MTDPEFRYDIAQEVMDTKKAFHTLQRVKGCAADTLFFYLFLHYFKKTCRIASNISL